MRQWQNILHVQRGHCPVFGNSNLRTPGSLEMLFTRCSHEVSW